MIGKIFYVVKIVFCNYYIVRRYFLNNSNKTTKFKANPTYQDSLFCNLFSDLKYARPLINTLCSTNYSDTDFKNITLHYVLRRGMYNDLAFLTKDQQLIILFEHQSTFDPNIPLRTLLYAVDAYKKWLNGEYGGKKFNIHSRRKIHLPKPKIFVFFTGNENRPAIETLTLFSGSHSIVQCEVICYNLNKYDKLPLLHNNLPLKGYQTLIHTVKENRKKGLDKFESIKQAVEHCMQQGYLVDYLSTKQSEVYDMLAREYTFEDELKTARKESFEDGFHTGKRKGFHSGHFSGTQLTKKVFKLFLQNYTVQEISKQCKISEKKVNEILN